MWQLHLRDLSSLDDTPIPGTEGASGPFFSPDGEWLAFFDPSLPSPIPLKKVSLRGGAPQIINHGITSSSAGGASWGSDDTIIFSNAVGGYERQLWRVPASGGEPEQLTQPRGLMLEDPELNHHWPDILPGGKAVLYTSATGPLASKVEVLDLDTGSVKTLIDPGTYARYVSTGHLIYAWAGDLFAVPFDTGKLEVTGPPIRVVKDVLMTWTGNAQFSVSDNGSLIYVSNDHQATDPSSNAKIVWVDHDGREEEALALPGQPRSIRISPDGKSLAATNAGRLANVWLYDLERGTGRPISEDRTFESWPIWTPDGRGIVYNSNRAGGPMLNLFRWHMDESIPPHQLTDRTFRQQPETWSADGKTLIFASVKMRVLPSADHVSGC